MNKEGTEPSGVEPCMTKQGFAAAGSPNGFMIRFIQELPRVVGYTHASRVIEFVKFNEAELATVMSDPAPKERAFPKRPPAVHVAPLMEPTFPCPETSPTVAPLLSSKPYAATRVLAGSTTEITTLLEVVVLTPSETVNRAMYEPIAS